MSIVRNINFAGLTTMALSEQQKEMLHKGPHMFLRIIPTPTHGTLTKIMKASLARMIGISLLASLLWFSGVLWFLVDEAAVFVWHGREEHFQF